MKTSHGFVNHLLVYSLVTIGSTGLVGLGTVWTRRQISLVANENKALTASIAEVDRRSQEVASQIAAEQDPSTLQQRNIAWKLGLVGAQIIRVSQDPEAVLAAKHASSIFSDGQTPVFFTDKP